MEKYEVKNGVDHIDDARKLLKGKRIGLITTASGVNKLGRPTYSILADEYRLDVLFSLEHGIRSDMQDGGWGQNSTDPETSARLISLRREHDMDVENALAALDIIVYDVQDVGARYYTYIYALFDMMRKCARFGIPVLVLDRVDPIGSRTEGEFLDETRFSSGIGRYCVPTRYGLTAGEFARYINTEKNLGAEKNLGCELHVLECVGWQRDLYMDETDLLFVNPSPNIPSVGCAVNYIGTGIIEATNVSEGRGTTRPFDLIGAPFLRSKELAEKLNDKKMDGVIFRRAYFTPQFNKFSGEVCEGVELHITDRDSYSPTRAGLELFMLLREYPEFTVRENGLCLRFGTDALLAPDFNVDSFMEDNIRRNLDFTKTTEKYKLY